MRQSLERIKTHWERKWLREKTKPETSLEFLCKLMIILVLWGVVLMHDIFIWKYEELYGSSIRNFRTTNLKKKHRNIQHQQFQGLMEILSYTYVSTYLLDKAILSLYPKHLLVPKYHDLTLLESTLPLLLSFFFFFHKAQDRFEPSWYWRRNTSILTRRTLKCKLYPELEI